MRIIQVAASSASAGAGILPGDVIVGLDGQAVRDVEDLLAAAGRGAAEPVAADWAPELVAESGC